MATRHIGVNHLLCRLVKAADTDELQIENRGPNV
jgi:hypothetical protein